MNKRKKGSIDMTQSVTQAYQQAPWRNQIKWIVIFMLGLLVVALVAGLYLSISAQSVALGIEIQGYNSNKITIDRNIADLRNQLADLTTTSEMEKRAKELGYDYLSPDEIEYFVVPGYSGRQTAILAPRSEENDITKAMLDPSYTQSLWEWFFQGLNKVSEYPNGSSQ
jgi:cell division protein FtsB